MYMLYQKKIKNQCLILSTVMSTSIFMERVQVSVIYFEMHQQIQMDLWLERGMDTWMCM